MTDFFQKNLFKNISLDEYKHLISCMEGRIKTFRPDETICCYDSGSQEIGIIGRGKSFCSTFRIQRGQDHFGTTGSPEHLRLHALLRKQRPDRRECHLRYGM